MTKNVSVTRYFISQQTQQCESTQAGTFQLRRDREIICPPGYRWNYTVKPYTYCYRDEKAAPACERHGADPVGNPIDPLDGAKLQVERDYAASGNSELKLVRRYRSYGHPRRDEDPDAAFGDYWKTDFQRQISLEATGDPPLAFADRADGTTLLFKQENGVWQSLPIGVDRLIEVAVPSAALRWILVNQHNEMELYDSQGKLTSIVKHSGSGVRIDHSSPVLVQQVTDSFGRSLRFSYGDGDVIKSVELPGGALLSYETDYQGLSKAPAHLTAVQYPDLSRRRYFYGETVGGTTSPAPGLSGIADEAGVRYATFGYLSTGAADSTQHAGGVSKYTIAPNPQYNSTSVTDPAGTKISYTTALVAGLRRTTGTSQPAGSGCSAANSTTAYLPDGRVESSVDFKQRRTCYAYDADRNVENVRVEGLSASATCSNYMSTGVALPSDARKTSTEWHPDWRLQTKVAEPGRITTSVYNGQSDPFNGGAVASCAPATALLPDGKPIAVLCKQVEQATTDADGHLGFSAALQAGVASRVQQWTYNEYGQVLTATDPRGNTSTYSYYSDTTAGHTRGDLQQVVDAAGLVTQYPRYNPHGQVLQMVDANGVATDYTYDLRQRLTGVASLGQSTTYDYWPTGLLKKLTQPDGSYLRYDYDDAHRLTDVSDGQGNSVHYTLDNAGNRTKEETKDATGALARQLSRSMDALSRVQQTTGRE